MNGPETKTVIAPRGRRLLPDLAPLLAHRELLGFFVWRDLKVRYKQTMIGAAWAVIQPFMTMVVFSLFFGRLAKMPADGLPHPVFYYSALVPWTYFAGALNNATNTLVQHQQMIKKIYFPRIFLPMSAVLSGLVDFALAAVVLAGMLAYYGIAPPAGVLILPLLLLLTVLLAMGAGLWLSALNARYRDVRYAVPFGIQFWLFASPIAYPASMVPERWRTLYGLNPMAGILEGFRWGLTGHGTGPGPMLWVSTATILLVLASGWLYFDRTDRTLADVV